MKKIDNYFKLVKFVYNGDMSLKTFVELFDFDVDTVRDELSDSAQKVGTTYSDDPKPMYFFDYESCPKSVELLHLSKLYAFAKNGTPYKYFELSDYDIRSEDPYTQAAVFDPEKGMFITGMRFLPLYQGISYEKSSMNDLFLPEAEFLDKYVPCSLEFGQTFIDPDTQNTPQGQTSLFSIMGAVIARNSDARFLIGRPTIHGVMLDIGKNIVTSLMYDAFGPYSNIDLNPWKKDLVSHPNNIIVQEINPFSDLIKEYNRQISGTSLKQITYSSDLNSRKKVKLGIDMLEYYLVGMPPIITFYSKITNNGSGFLMLGKPIVNSAYTTRSIEFSILVDKEKISTLHWKFVEHANKFI